MQQKRVLEHHKRIRSLSVNCPSEAYFPSYCLCYQSLCSYSIKACFKMQYSGKMANIVIYQHTTQHSCLFTPDGGWDGACDCIVPQYITFSLNGSTFALSRSTRLESISTRNIRVYHFRKCNEQKKAQCIHQAVATQVS